MDVRRRSFLTGTALAALASTQAKAQTAFTAFSFQATNGTGSRTMPDRIADVKNVKDFGAVGDNSHDDTKNIQNAVNWTAAANRGTIFFPAGTYKITSPITFNTAGINICFMGEGAASILLASFGSANTGYVLDRSLVSPSNTGTVIIEKLTIQDGGGKQGNGAVRLGSCINAIVRDSAQLTGYTCFTSEDSPGNSSQNVLLQNIHFQGATQAGCNGVVMGNGGSLQTCDFIGCDNAMRLYGKGFFVGGCRAENCNTAYLLGLDTTTVATLTNATISGTTLSFASASGTVAIGQQLLDTLGNVPGGLKIISGSGTTWTLNNPGATVSTPQTMTTQGKDVGASGFAICGNTTEGNWYNFDFAGTCSGFIISAVAGNDHAASNSGMTTGIQGGQWGVYVRANKASNGYFMGVSSAGDMTGGSDVAALQVDAATSRANLFFQGCNFTKGGGAGVNFIAPSNAYTAQFQYCNVNPIWTYSQLPTVGGGNDQEGDEFTISDALAGNCSDSACGWGANVTGGTGALHRLVRNNGSNYTVVAK